MSQLLSSLYTKSIPAQTNVSTLVFIDPRVEDPQFLADSVISEAKAFILEREQDGIKQISEILQNYAEVASIHLVSHGSPGSIQLGNTYLSLHTLAKYQLDLNKWFRSIDSSISPSLLIYGCNVAAGDAGEELVNKLHQLTGANIAASKTKTGNSVYGGDWNLEIATSKHQTKLAFRQNFLAQYPFTFAERVSVNNDDIQGNDGSYNPSISADGHYVAFWSNASNLVPGDTNTTDGIFVYDRQEKTTERVSVNSNGIQGNSYSYNPSISADGRYVAFWSNASNLVPDDTNAVTDIFVYDRQEKTTERVSVDSNGTQSNNRSLNPIITADGRYVTFGSDASNLVPGDTNTADDVFVYDRQEKTTERVSVNNDGTEGNSYSVEASISANGRYVTFESNASNLVPGDTNAVPDIFVYDRQEKTSELVSVNSNGIQGNNRSLRPSISADSRYVTFMSNASNLVSGDTNDVNDIFVYDRQEKITELVSVDNNGTQGNDSSYNSTISANGRYVTFRSNASNLVPGDTNAVPDIFVYDRQEKTTKRMSVDHNGTESNDSSYNPTISADGRYVTFQSIASNLVTDDTNNTNDVFVVKTLPLSAIADTNITDEDDISTVETLGVLENDQGDGITVTEFDKVSSSGAKVTVTNNGSYTYDPTMASDIQALGEGELLDDTFNYTIEDSSEATASATVTISVSGANDEPVVTAIDSGSINEDAADAFTIDLLATASDVDSDELSVVGDSVTATSEDSDRKIDFSFDEMTHEFSLDPNQFNDLAGGESETISVDYSVGDGIATIANTATFVVEGRNDDAIEPSLDLVEVRRFFEDQSEYNFYTADNNEVEYIREEAESGDLDYDYEGESFAVLESNLDSLSGEVIKGAEEIHRFFNQENGAHFYTIFDQEKDYILENLDNYQYEGIVNYAFESEPENLETIPLYRMFNSSTGTHLFSTDLQEINSIQENIPEFSLEGDNGVAYYVLEL